MNKKAFTLIELIVWITISMMLMISVGIFVNNWMANILTQQKVIKNTTEFTDYISSLDTAINLMSSWSFTPQKTASWIIFKRDQNLWEWGFSYIWEMNSTDNSDWDWIYCLSWSENTNTKHLVLKNFIPFEEETDDIFSNYSNILKSTILTGYQSIQKENKIIDFTTKQTIIWKWVFWNKFEEWASWKDIYLNSPTWLAKQWNILFISDTLNNRILYYKIIDDKIYTLLDESDWLNEPTWLYYSTSDKALYIANSWNWEILKYSSKNISTPELTMSWFFENVNKIEVSFSWNNNPNTNTWLFNTINTYTNNYLTWSINNFLYYWYKINLPEYTETDCNWKSNWDLIFDTSETTKPIKYCTKSWSWKTISLENKNITEIKINNLNGFSETWSYYVNLKLFNNSTEEYSEYFPYFTKSDDNILTPDDNKLEIIKSWLNYPTWIWNDSWTIKYNEFWNRTFTNLTLDTHSSDIILKTPLKSLTTSIDNWLITFLLKYYKKYNCYNLDDKTERTYLIKKNLD